jgi:glycosyltransferase involved in cell wall biosynthesis
MHKSTCVFTIASKNYLSQARTLLASFHDHHPEVQPYFVLCDRVDGYFDPAVEGFTTIAAEQLPIERFAEMAMKYNCLELNTAIKPFAIHALFEEFGHEQVIYLDPDIVVYRRLTELLELLDQNELLLTPHITEFLPDDGHLPDNVRILQTGTNNLGFVAMRRSPRVRQFVEWWSTQLYDKCRHAITEGLFVDQKWMDLAVSCVESAVLLRHPGYNVAYWNLPHRRVARGPDGGYLINGQPLAFFHFSGFSPNSPSTISKYQSRLRWNDLGRDGQSLFEDYARRLMANEFQPTQRWPYAFGCFDNGVPIPDCFRTFFGQKFADRLASETEIFSTSPERETVFGLMQSSVRGGPLTWGALALHQAQPDLQKVFPEVPGRDAVNYAHWFADSGGGPTRLSEAFVEPVRELLKAVAPPSQAVPRRRWWSGWRRVPAQLAMRILRFAGRRNDLLKIVPRGLRQWLGRGVRKWAYRPSFAAPSVGQRQAQNEHSRLQPGVNLLGLFGRPTGVGEAARGMATCFQRLDLPSKTVCFDEQNLFYSRPLGRDAQPNRQFAINYCHVNADGTDALRVLFGDEAFAGRFNIGFWAWELENFPAKLDNAFAPYQEIWVPSTFVQRAVAARARVPVICMPHCVQFASPPQSRRSHFGLPENRPLVLCMFDTGSYSERKNPLAAIRAVKQAAAGGPDPLLVIKVGRPEYEDGLLDELHREVQHLDCRIIEGWLERDETLDLIATCDMFVSLHRSEGFGLILAEAMALGKPVVATAYSGNMDFMTPTNSFPVGYELATLPCDVGPYPAGSRWAEPDVEHAARLIRSVLNDPAHTCEVGRRAAADIAAMLSAEAISRRILERLERLGFAAGLVAEPSSQQTAMHNQQGMEFSLAEKAA